MTAKEKKRPESQIGYGKTKDVGAVAPKDADVPFDDTQKSIEENWEMWPKPTMPISWSLVDSLSGGGKVLMTSGGKRWGTHPSLCSCLNITLSPPESRLLGTLISANRTFLLWQLVQ